MDWKYDVPQSIITQRFVEHMRQQQDAILFENVIPGAIIKPEQILTAEKLLALRDKLWKPTLIHCPACNAVLPITKRECISCGVGNGESGGR